MRKGNETEAVVLQSSVVKTFTLGWGMVLLYVILNSYGAFVLKNQIQKLGIPNLTTFRTLLSYFFALFSSFQTWVGIGAICFATGAWIIALAHLELSKAYPVAIGINMLLIVGLSFLYFNEPITLSKLLGVLLILCGAIALFR